MRSVRSTMIISKEYSQAFILLTAQYIFLTLKSAANALSFRVFQNTSHRETNFLSKQLYFQSSIDYTEIIAATWSS